MSRTSRRVSRPLIAALAVVIVLGIFFTIHKLHQAHGTETAKAAIAAAPTDTTAPIPAAPAPPTQPALVAVSMPVPTTRPVTTHQGSREEPDTLVTQTPTAPTGQTPVSISEASQPPSVPATDRLSNSRSPTPESAPADGAGDVSPKTHDAIAAPALVSVQPLVEARTKADAGDLPSARQALNDALISGRLSEADADAAKKQIEQLNQTLVFSAKKFPDDPWGGTYQVASGERLGTIANKHACSWEFLARVNGITPKKLRSGQYIKIFKGPFHAVVYKHLFRMEIYLGAPGGPGSMYVASYPVGLGKDDSTPNGLWLCKAGDKIRHPRYYPPRGGDIIDPNDPKNPLGGYWIALEGQDGQAIGKESYGIHGTIDPSSIGKMESMGCIRLRQEDISWVFDLLVDGKSKVLVKD